MVLKHLESKDEFKDWIMNDSSIVMIHKTHCPFCERAMPWLEEHSESFPDANIAVVNKDVIADVLELFQVQMYPTFVAFKAGKVTDTFFGDTVYDKVKAFVEKNKS